MIMNKKILRLPGYYSYEIDFDLLSLLRENENKYYSILKSKLMKSRQSKKSKKRIKKSYLKV